MGANIPRTPRNVNQTARFETPQYNKAPTEWNFSEIDRDFATPEEDNKGATNQFSTDILEKNPDGSWKSAVSFPRLNLDGKDRVWEMDETYKRWRDGCEMAAATVNVQFQRFVMEMFNWSEYVSVNLLETKPIDSLSHQGPGLTIPKMLRQNCNLY